MQDGATLLHAHVVASTQNLAILRDQASANGDAALGGALLRLFNSRDETRVLLHGDYIAIDSNWVGVWGNMEGEKAERAGRGMTVRAYLVIYSSS